MQTPNGKRESIICEFLQKNAGIGKPKRAIFKFIKNLESFAGFARKFFALLLQDMGYNTIVTTKKTFFQERVIL